MRKEIHCIKPEYLIEADKNEASTIKHYEVCKRLHFLLSASPIVIFQNLRSKGQGFYSLLEILFLKIIVDLQCCISFRYMVKGFSYTYIYIYYYYYSDYIPLYIITKY